MMLKSNIRKCTLVGCSLVVAGAMALASAAGAAQDDAAAVESPLHGGALVGDWTWQGDQPLVNRAQPGVNDATAMNDAVAMDGVAVVKQNEDKRWNDDEHFAIGHVEALREARAFALTMHDVTLDEADHHVLAGGVTGRADTLFEGSSFYVAVSRRDDSPAVRLALWGQSDAGEQIKQELVWFTSNDGITVEYGKSYDIQVVWDGEDQTGRNARLRLRSADADTWGGFVEKATEVRTLSDSDVPLSIGKYNRHSSMIGDFATGRVTLHAR